MNKEARTALNEKITKYMTLLTGTVGGVPYMKLEKNGSTWRASVFFKGEVVYYNESITEDTALLGLANLLENTYKERIQNLGLPITKQVQTAVQTPTNSQGIGTEDRVSRPDPKEVLPEAARTIRNHPISPDHPFLYTITTQPTTGGSVGNTESKEGLEYQNEYKHKLPMSVNVYGALLDAIDDIRHELYVNLIIKQSSRYDLCWSYDRGKYTMAAVYDQDTLLTRVKLTYKLVTLFQICLPNPFEGFDQLRKYLETLYEAQA